VQVVEQWFRETETPLLLPSLGALWMLCFRELQDAGKTPFIDIWPYAVKRFFRAKSVELPYSARRANDVEKRTERMHMVESRSGLKRGMKGPQYLYPLHENFLALPSLTAFSFTVIKPLSWR